tara:strand:- start:305 stop:925 length:621 start_codon:yes stop_codon:yes gene_type:complete
MELMTQQKEKVDMILEPLQVMIQLAVISHCPVGTKVSINENLLVIQQPAWSQGILRWYKNDNKDDLYYLFHAIRRYYIWYKKKDNKIYNYILEKAIGGLNKLIETYKKSDRQSILHTLNLYKNVLELDNTALFKNEEEHTVTMDSVFGKIIGLYNEKTLRVAYNTLLLLDDETNPENKEHYINSLSNFLMPINNSVRVWIQENLVF